MMSSSPPTTSKRFKTSHDATAAAASSAPDLKQAAASPAPAPGMEEVPIGGAGAEDDTSPSDNQLVESLVAKFDGSKGSLQEILSAMVIRQKEELTKEILAWKEELTKEILAWKEELTKVKLARQKAIAETNYRIDKLTGGMKPATDYALMESVVYMFVEKVIPVGWNSGNSKDKIQYGVTDVCRKVLQVLTGTSVELPKSFSWQGPPTTNKRTATGQPIFPNSSLFSLVQSGLIGLTTFVDINDKTLISGVADGQGMNHLAHNGDLLSALYNIPYSRSGSAMERPTTYDDAETKINFDWSTFKEESDKFSERTLPSSGSFRDIVDNLARTLKGKGFSPEDEQINLLVRLLDNMTKNKPT